MTVTLDAPRADRPSEADLVVSARDLTRRYGSGDTAVDALRGVSLDIPRGQLTAVMGPSGSGKSTLMHILAGLDKPTSGTVEIDGTEITSLNDTALTKLRRTHIGFVFQFFNLLPMLTAEENITLPLAVAGRKPEERWLEELLDATGLADRRTHRPAELSGGQQQRVAVARAIAGDPKLVLADEPTGNLDSLMARQVMDLLEKINEMGTTIIMVTHDPELARRAHRNVQVVDGQISDFKPYEPHVAAPAVVAHAPHVAGTVIAGA